MRKRKYIFTIIFLLILVIPHDNMMVVAKENRNLESKPNIFINYYKVTHDLHNNRLLSRLMFNISDPYFSDEWWLENTGYFKDDNSLQSFPDIDMNILEAWKIYKGHKNITIAIIDSGIDISNRDLRNSIWTNSSEIPNDNIDNDKNGYIDDFNGWNFCNNSNVIYDGFPNGDHGTHIAGIIAAERNNIGIAGIASFPNIKIMTLKAISLNDNSRLVDSYIRAIKYADSMGASICNISASLDYYDVNLKATIENSKMLFVVSAGNGKGQDNGHDIDKNPIYPASYNCDNIISVANIQCNGTLCESSNYGTQNVDIAAPGTSILSSVSNNKYNKFTGTSMAAPMVTGALALIYSYDNITLSKAKYILLSTVKKVPSLKNKISCEGIPDVYTALSYINSTIK